MIDVYIWIGVWVVILIMLIISLMKIENEIAEDRINKMLECLKKRKKERLAMPRHIDADEGREFIVPEGDCGGEWLGYKELVRCKDCKFYDEAERLCNDTSGFDRWWKPNDFCSYGERREE